MTGKTGRKEIYTMFVRIRVLLITIKEWLIRKYLGYEAYMRRCGLNLGAGCIFPSGTGFGSEPFLITLHNNVRISSNVTFLTHDGSVHTLASGEYANKPLHRYGKIEIDDNTFIGANVTILPNVHIGKNCIIGTGAIVTSSIPDNSVAVGIPAKVIANTWDLAEKTLKRMPEDWNNDAYIRNSREYLTQIIPDPPKA